MEDWVLRKLEQGLINHPEWAVQLHRCKALFNAFEIPDEKDVSFLSTFFQARLVVTYGDNLEPVQTCGDASWREAKLCNLPSVDGAGKSAPHFRYIWVSSADKMTFASGAESVYEASG